MDESFDPYFKWLGIPAEEQPPNHYRLLGLPVFTADPDVIENLAEQRIRHVRSYQIGPHAEHATQLLNEFAAARVCLLDPQRRSKYDATLRQAEVPPAISAIPAIPAVPAVPDLPSPLAINSKTKPKSRRGRRHTPWWVYSAVSAAVVVLIWFGMQWIGQSSDIRDDAETVPIASIEPPNTDGASSRPRIDVRQISPPPTTVPSAGSSNVGSSNVGSSTIGGNAQPDPPRGPAIASMGSAGEEAENDPPDDPEGSSGEDDWTLQISTREGRGGDAMVQRGVNQRFGVDPLLGVRTRGGVEIAHTYLRFDLSQLNATRRQQSDVKLVLTVLGNQIPSGEIRVMGISETPWSENLIEWNNSLSSPGLGSNPVLVSAPLSGNQVQLGSAVSEIQLTGAGLNEFIAQAGSTVTLAVAGSIEGDEWLRFTSREHSSRFAPRLVFSASSQKPNQNPGRFSSPSLIQFRLIPAGQFMMGSDDAPFNADRHPAHRVTINQPFYISETEITQAQWERVMRTSPWGAKPYALSGNDFPATFVSWLDAREFCRRLSQQERRTYRLPTEAEWEYACRAGSNAQYCFGNAESMLNDYGWFDKNAMLAKESYAHRVARKQSNAFGLFDMHGNVWEWCNDWYESTYYRRSAASVPGGPTGGTERVLRGGGWGSEAPYCTSAYRDKFKADYKSADLGFRVVLEPRSL